MCIHTDKFLRGENVATCIRISAFGFYPCPSVVKLDRSGRVALGICLWLKMRQKVNNTK